MPVIQSDFSQQVLRALPGQFAEAFSPRRVTNKFGRDLLRAGLMAFQLPPTSGDSVAKLNARGYPGEVYQIVGLGTAADVDAIGTITSATGTKTIGSGVTAGAAGASGGPLRPARKVTVTFDASTDWDPSTAVIRYVNGAGATVQENLAVATSTTATTLGNVQSFISLAVPAQTGAGGTATIGVAALQAGAISIDNCAGIVVRQPVKTMHNASDLYGYPGVASSAPNAHYVDGDTVPLLEIGDIWVETEEAITDRDPVFVRIASGAGGTQIGTFRNDADSASCIVVPGARFKRSSPAGAAWASFAAF